MADFPLSATPNDGATAAANPISLAHVLALSVPVHWTESVAVIEELCQVLSANGDPVLVPDAQDVVITAQGTVMVHRGARGVMDVEGIGRLLNTLLDPVTTPIPLRLFVAHSIGSEKYQSVAAYGEALAYYARPDRAELIQALYRRCLESSAAVAPLVDEPIPVEPPPLPHAEPEPLVAKRGIPRWLPLVAVFLLVVGAAYFVSRHFARSGAPQPVHQLATMAAGVMKSVRQFFAPAAAAVTPPPAPVEAEGPRTVRVARTERVSSSPATQSDILSSAAPLDLPSSILPATPVPVVSSAPQVLLPLDGENVTEGALALAPVAVDRPERGAFTDSTIYTQESADVQPPVLYSPKLPPVPPVQPNLLGTNTMALLIDPTGAVQQALLTSPPVRLSDMLLLSAAKTWKFHPALKDGRPVTYRLTLSWAVAPP